MDQSLRVKSVPSKDRLRHDDRQAFRFSMDTVVNVERSFILELWACPVEASDSTSTAHNSVIKSRTEIARKQCKSGMPTLRHFPMLETNEKWLDVLHYAQNWERFDFFSDLVAAKNTFLECESWNSRNIIQEREFNAIVNRKKKKILAMSLPISDLSFNISSRSSLMSFTFGSSLMVGLFIIFLALLAYLKVLRVSP